MGTQFHFYIYAYRSKLDAIRMAIPSAFEVKRPFNKGKGLGDQIYIALVTIIYDPDPSPPFVR